MSFLIGNGTIKTYPGRVLTAQEFAIMMDRMSIIHSGIIEGCVIAYSNSTFSISSGWVGVRGRLVRIEQSTFQIPTSGTSKWKVVVKFNLGESTEPSSIYCYEYDTTLTDTVNFNTDNNGIAYCILGEIDLTDASNPVITQNVCPERGTMVTYTLTAGNWDYSSKTYTITSPLVTATSYQRLLPGIDITETQLRSLQEANIQDGGQTTGSLTIKAFGNVPLVDIPIRIVYLGG